MSVSERDVRQVAALARLGIDEARIGSLVEELNGILGHMDVLQRADISMLADESAGAGMPLRADEAPPVALEHARESFAPLMRDGFFLVPRLATHESAGSTAAALSGDAES